MPKKHLREVSGIKPGDKVLIEARFGELWIKKVFRLKKHLIYQKSDNRSLKTSFYPLGIPQYS